LDSIGEDMNPKWLENKILEMMKDIKDLKEIMRAVNKDKLEPNKRN
jgi:hypothetical protein